MWISTLCPFLLPKNEFFPGRQFLAEGYKRENFPLPLLDEEELTRFPAQMLLPQNRYGMTLLEVMTVCFLVAALALGVCSALAHATAHGKATACLSNMRHIGMTILLYSNEHGGALPPTSRITEARGIEETWITLLSPYLNDIDSVWLCPATEPERKTQLLAQKATSYLLNNLVFDDPKFNHLLKIPLPSSTLFMCALSADKKPALTVNHANANGWTRWSTFLADVEPDQHRIGSRSADRTRGSSNYLYADGHVKSIPAREMKNRLDKGINPASIAPAGNSPIPTTPSTSAPR